MRTSSLSGAGPFTTLGANMEERNRVANVMAETRSSDPASVAVVTTQECVKSESGQELSVLQSNDDSSSLVATTHDRPLGDVIGELDANSVREAQRFVDERLATPRKVYGAIVSAQAKTMCRPNWPQKSCILRVGDKVLLSTKLYLSIKFQYYLVVVPNYPTIYRAFHCDRGSQRPKL